MYGTYTIQVPGDGIMFVTAEEARRPKQVPPRFVGYDAQGNHGDSIRCNCCYLNFEHSAALHAADVTEYNLAHPTDARPVGGPPIQKGTN